MKQHGMVVAIIILALIIVGMFVFAFLKRSELTTPLPPTESLTPDSGSGAAGLYDSITRIDAKHFFDGKTHTLVGEIMLPTRCDLLNWTSVVGESMPEQVLIAFQVINNEGTCEPSPTPQRFMTSFDASKNAVIRATIMGREVVLNLIPALPDEKPEDFELFIKG